MTLFKSDTLYQTFERDVELKKGFHKKISYYILLGL